MKERVEVRTQAELDAALAADKFPVCIGNGRFVARDSSHVVARDSSHVVAWGSSHVVARDSSHVVARDSSHVVARDSSHVVAWGSSHVVARDSSHVVARDSSHVEAWGSSHVEAWGSSHVEAWGSSHVEAAAAAQVAAHGNSTIKAGQYNAVTKHGDESKITGGVLIVPPKITTAEQWCEWHGVEVVDGIATLYKAVDDHYHSENPTPAGDHISYAPGAAPEAPDWDGGRAECGYGLHFSPSPAGAKGFNWNATRYVACPVALVDISVHPKPLYPSKVKARAVSAPGCYEVDIRGRRIEISEAASV